MGGARHRQRHRSVPACARQRGRGALAPARRALLWWVELGPWAAGGRGGGGGGGGGAPEHRGQPHPTRMECYAPAHATSARRPHHPNLQPTRPPTHPLRQAWTQGAPPPSPSAPWGWAPTWVHQTPRLTSWSQAPSSRRAPSSWGVAGARAQGGWGLLVCGGAWVLRMPGGWLPARGRRGTRGVARWGLHLLTIPPLLNTLPLPPSVHSRWARGSTSLTLPPTIAAGWPSRQVRAAAAAGGASGAGRRPLPCRSAPLPPPLHSQITPTHCHTLTVGQGLMALRMTHGSERNQLFISTKAGYATRACVRVRGCVEFVWGRAGGRCCVRLYPGRGVGGGSLPPPPLHPRARTHTDTHTCTQASPRLSQPPPPTHTRNPPPLDAAYQLQRLKASGKVTVQDVMADGTHCMHPVCLRTSLERSLGGWAGGVGWGGWVGGVGGATGSAVRESVD